MILVLRPLEEMKLDEAGHVTDMAVAFKPPRFERALVPLSTLNRFMAMNMASNLRFVGVVHGNIVRSRFRAMTALEYALIAALVAVVIIGGVSLLGTNVSKVFSTVAATI